MKLLSTISFRHSSRTFASRRDRIDRNQISRENTVFWTVSLHRNEKIYLLVRTYTNSFQSFRTIFFVRTLFESDDSPSTFIPQFRFETIPNRWKRNFFSPSTDRGKVAPRDSCVLQLCFGDSEALRFRVNDASPFTDNRLTSFGGFHL